MGDIRNFLLPNEPTCIVACSAATARFWRSDSRFGDWTALAELSDELASNREADYASDRPGRAFDSAGHGRHAMSAPESGQDHQKQLFARRVADYLNRAIAANEVNVLVIIAGPAFLGFLRTELSEAARKAVTLAAPKNLSNLDEGEIRKYFE